MVSRNPRVPSRFDRGVRTVLVGLSSNIVLAAVKVAAGILGNSYALTADGIESTLDIFSSAVVLGGIKISELPADENHPYGHGKAESLAAMTASSVLMMVGLGIAVRSSLDILEPHHTPAVFTLIILAAVIIIKNGLFKRIFSVGESINSLSIKTEAWHHRSDAWSSAAAFIGISIAILGGKAYQSADDWAALAASGIIIFNGLHMLKAAVAEIMDQAPDPQTEETIRTIAGKVAGVAAIEKCKVRKSGLDLFVDIHVEVAGTMQVHEAHLIGHNVKDALMASTLGIADVLVHIEPAK
ncbi:MAG: cation transporter [Candidatus Omnitrophica bacterium]|nr:cation transporter [Candidatus Omnitrophota bacterium]MDE2008622.1 cation transporter [Candidatus Omnitrophota bacterium]MDE2214088.1 cation transporter [Candidatus Omnitrophota bacterium]MDE2230934.1 cation transporter [Candidatus Omnitrophota bacterium]